MPRTGVTSDRSQPPFVDQPVVGGDPPGQGQQAGPCVCSATLSWLVPGVIVTATRVLVGGGQVDEVVTDAGAGDRTQPRGHREELGRHPLAAGDQGVDPGQVRQQLLAGERRAAGRIDRLEAGLGEDVAEPPGRVAE